MERDWSPGSLNTDHSLNPMFTNRGFTVEPTLFMHHIPVFQLYQLSFLATHKTYFASNLLESLILPYIGRKSVEKLSKHLQFKLPIGFKPTLLNISHIMHYIIYIL